VTSNKSNNEYDCFAPTPAGPSNMQEDESYPEQLETEEYSDKHNQDNKEEDKKSTDDEEKGPATTIDGMLKEYFTDNMHEPPIKYCTVFQDYFHMHYGNISSSDEDTSSESEDQDSDDCCRDEDYSDQEGDQINRLTVQQSHLVAESGSGVRNPGQVSQSPKLPNQPKLTTLRSAGEDVRGLMMLTSESTNEITQIANNTGKVHQHFLQIEMKDQQKHV